MRGAAGPDTTAGSPGLGLAEICSGVAAGLHQKSECHKRHSGFIVAVDRNQWKNGPLGPCSSRKYNGL
jgi:hypothetical protein